MDAGASHLVTAGLAAHPQRRLAHRDRLVTVAVPTLPSEVVAAALQNGTAVALDLQARGLVAAVVLVCQGQVQLVVPSAGFMTLPDFTTAA